MNYVMQFLNTNRQRLSLEQYGLGRHPQCLLVTPRFRASGHVVFVVLSERTGDPLLVAKVPRLLEASASIEREAAGLQLVQQLRPGGFDSIPRLIACEE